jgi:hypothetical protein
MNGCSRPVAALSTGQMAALQRYVNFSMQHTRTYASRRLAAHEAQAAHRQHSSPASMDAFAMATAWRFASSVFPSSLQLDLLQPEETHQTHQIIGLCLQATGCSRRLLHQRRVLLRG